VTGEWLEEHGMPWCFREDSGAMATESEQPFVINLDDSDGPGTHWTAAGRKGKTLFYGDPFGIILSGYVPAELLALNRGRKHDAIVNRIVENRVAWQQPSTNLCGYYAFIIAKAIDELGQKATVAQFERQIALGIS
jgi:hypothetical protein